MPLLWLLLLCWLRRLHLRGGGQAGVSVQCKVRKASHTQHMPASCSLASGTGEGGAAGPSMMTRSRACVCGPGMPL